MKKVFVDTNILIRALTNDHPVLSKNAKKFLEENLKISQLCTTDCVIAECVYVLSSKTIGYRLDKKQLVKVLGDFILLTDIDFPSKPLVWEALNIYANENMDLCDILLFLSAKKEGAQVFSFDDDVKRLGNKYP